METFLNSSNGSIVDPGDFFQLPLKLQVGMTFAYVIIFVISLVGNLLMVYVIFKTPHLRTTTNLLMANMAIADLMITFFAMPYCVMFLYLQNIWISGIFGDITCRIVQYALALSIAASILTHSFIALDRFFGIVLFLRRITFIKNPKISFSFIWCSSFILMSPYLVVYGSEQFGPEGTSYCIVNFKYLYFLQVYFCLVLLLLYVLPLVFIAILYTLICRKLWKHKAPGILSRTSTQRREAHKRKTVKMLIILVIAFALCWLPAHIMHLFTYFWYDTALPVVVTLLSFWACHSHSAINPLLMMSFNGVYRKACREMIRNFRRTLPPENNAYETANVRLVTFSKSHGQHVSR